MNALKIRNDCNCWKAKNLATRILSIATHTHMNILSTQIFPLQVGTKYIPEVFQSCLQAVKFHF